MVQKLFVDLTSWQHRYFDAESQRKNIFENGLFNFVHELRHILEKFVLCCYLRMAFVVIYHLSEKTVTDTFEVYLTAYRSPT